MTTLQADSITVGYGEDPVLDGLSFTVPHGRVTAIVGPNGCGKSTLLRTLARLLRPTAGSVRLDGQPLTELPSREIARRMALLPQTPVAPEGLLVRDLVARGRHPHQRWFSQWSHADEQIVADAMAATDTTDLADRALEQLSGGQRQRAWIAMTLAQDTELLLLDEPTTYLDLAHQVEVLDLVSQQNRVQGRTVVMVLHDLNLAARYSDTIVVMAAGEIVGHGSPAEVFTANCWPRCSAWTPTCSPIRGRACRSWCRWPPSPSRECRPPSRTCSAPELRGRFFSVHSAPGLEWGRFPFRSSRPTDVRRDVTE